MKKVGIVTDSTSCIPQELIVEHDIRVVPITVIIEGKSYRDGIDISPGEVYKIMRQRENLPTTSTPSAGDFLSAFHDLSQKTASILCTTVTAKQSKVYETALIARDMARDALPDTPIEVLDSQAAASALGIIVVEAARAAERDADLNATLSAARSMIPRVHYLATLDTLYYLARTGRIGRAAAWAGALLNIKPIVGHDTSLGVTIPVARPRTRAKAINRLLDLITEEVGGSPAHVIVTHADEPEEAERLGVELSSRLDCVELYLSEFSPGMGVHAGPGVISAAFYTDA